jgi:peptidylprolyl isomerase
MPTTVVTPAATLTAVGPSTSIQKYAPLGLELSVIKDSDSTHRPRPGQTVCVHYTGRLQESGVQFDSSRERGEPLTLPVGRGGCISGWDIALQQMSVGQTVRLVVPPALGYGRKGKAPIPGNAVLCFEIELLSIAEDTLESDLLDAAATGETARMAHAIACGANLEHRDRKGATALHLAADCGHTECVVRLLEASCDQVNALKIQPAGVTPLMLSVRAEDSLGVRALLCARADASVATAKGNSALSMASSSKSRLPPAVIELIRRSVGEAPTGTAVADVHWLGIGRVVGPGWELLRSEALWRAKMRRANPVCWLRLEHVESGASETIEVELWQDVVPKTAENFRCLCTGERGKSSDFSGAPLHFKNNAVHRIVPGQILQAGDITRGDGRGGESIYGHKFPDESFEGRAGSHHRKGLLSMANSGKHSNSSQFFITLDAMPHLDGKHVVFGCVLKGMEFVAALSGAAGDDSGVPTSRVVIADCGQCL